MIVWSGWGVLVAVFFAVGFFVGIPVSGMFGLESDAASGVTFIIAGLVAGLGSFLLARQLEKGEGRAYIDEATQQRIVVRPSAGSLFFIPTRYWAYVAPVVGILFGVLMMTDTSARDAADVAESPAAVSEAGPAAPTADVSPG